MLEVSAGIMYVSEIAQTGRALVRSNTVVYYVCYSAAVCLVAHEGPVGVELESTGGPIGGLESTCVDIVTMFFVRM